MTIYKTKNQEIGILISEKENQAELLTIYGNYLTEDFDSLKEVSVHKELEQSLNDLHKARIGLDSSDSDSLDTYNKVVSDSLNKVL